MEFGQYHFQIIFSFVMILGASCAALICDFLRNNNEQLRELTIELKVRREEEQKYLRPAAPDLPKSLAAPRERSMVSREKKRTVNSGALAAIERGAALAGSRGRIRSAQPEAVKTVKKDWGALLSRNAAPKADETSLPAGFQDGFVLEKMVQRHQLVSGLVVSIGVSGTLHESIRTLVESLVGPNDFATQSGDDEFLLIYPQERGASAQRRLSQVAQQLWDFQLRSLGSFDILFSWGGVEVENEPIEEAMGSASERMQETKRGRKLISAAV